MKIIHISTVKMGNVYYLHGYVMDGMNVEMAVMSKIVLVIDLTKSNFVVIRVFSNDILGCPNGFSHCSSNTSVCYDNIKGKCNGIADCPNGEDEYFCGIYRTTKSC